MFVELFIISVVMVAFFMLGLGIKLLIDPKAELTLHESCGANEVTPDKDDGCSQCQIKDLANCEEGKINAIKAYGS